MKDKPVIVVDEVHGEKFETRCAELIGLGYILVAAHIGFVPSEEYDFCGSHMAIFALPLCVAATHSDYC